MPGFLRKLKIGKMLGTQGPYDYVKLSSSFSLVFICMQVYKFARLSTCAFHDFKSLYIVGILKTFTIAQDWAYSNEIEKGHMW